MKTGFSACSLSGQGLDTTLDLVKKAGYDAIELSGIGSEVADDEKQAKLIVNKVADSGLVVEALPPRGEAEVEGALRELARLITGFCGGRVRCEVLGPGRSEAALKPE